MNLNFVSSAVLSSTDGVSHNEERPIESKEALSLRKNTTGVKPLFEQIQFNRDREREQYEEISKSMRGTRTLDDEDCAHLDSVSAVRMERERRIQQSVEEEVAEFKAARELLVQSSFKDSSSVAESNIAITSNNEPLSGYPQNHTQTQDNRKAKSKPQASLQLPILLGKKRRRTTDVVSSEDSNSTKICPDTKSVENPTTQVSVSETNSNRLGALLGCYGSDDEGD